MSKRAQSVPGHYFGGNEFHTAQYFLLRGPSLIWKVIPNEPPGTASQMLSSLSFKQMFSEQGHHPRWNSTTAFKAFLLVLKLQVSDIL